MGTFVKFIFRNGKASGEQIIHPETLEAMVMGKPPTRETHSQWDWAGKSPRFLAQSAWCGTMAVPVRELARWWLSCLKENLGWY